MTQLGKTRFGFYSCAGICCSTSRHALIFSLRHTQQRGSGVAEGASAPHTPHLTGALLRSVASERFAFSRISGEITGSGFNCGLRFMGYLYYVKSRHVTTTSRYRAVLSRENLCRRQPGAGRLS